MSVWIEEFANSSLEEVIERQAENRAWSKDLRLRNTSLVTSRLAKLINQADYVDARKFIQQDTAECQRRGILLHRQITRCRGLAFDMNRV
jgi:hypothetical protein